MRKLLFLCMMLVIFTGCGKQAAVESSYYGDDYQRGTDFDYTSYYWLQKAQTMIQTEQGYYFVAGQYLFFADSVNSEAVPLCFKTDCLHQEEEDEEKVPYCDAFMGGVAFTSPFLGYYQGHIYTICLDRNTGNSNLIEMKPDGSDRRAIYAIDWDNAPEQMFMHRGVIYFLNNLKNLDGESHYGLNAISVVSGSEKPVQVYSGVYENGWIQNVLAYGKHVFFKDCYRADKSFKGSVIMYDIKTGESEILLKEDQSGIYGIEDEKLLIRNDGQYYVYSLKERKLSPSKRNYETFLEEHPKWQCHCENAMDDMTLFSYYDEEKDDLATDVYVVNADGEVAAVLPDMGWSEESYLFEEEGEEYLFRYSSTQVSEFFINVYAKKDLLQGIVEPKTILKAKELDALMPAYSLHIGE